ncbi:MAG: hypothetical protein U9N45_05705, partial [Gemmatimonadota bacterium]|nr:hypothetical protein [Gemmatimonadota bacterium]
LDTGRFKAHTLSELIRSLELLVAPERVIISMNLDGEPLGRDSEETRSSSSIVELESLEIHTQNVGELACSTLCTLIDFLPSLIEAVNLTVRLFQGQDESQGHRNLSGLIDGLQMSSSAWDGISCFLGTEDVKAAELIPDTMEFSHILVSIVQAQEACDTVQVCDILEFKLVPLLESWLDKAARLSDFYKARE